MENEPAELEEKVKSILENLEHAPEGTVMALEPSNVKRANQTRELFIGKLGELLKDREDIEIVSLSENPEESEAILQTIKENPQKKYIIANLRGSWLIGFKENDQSLPIVNKWKNILKGNENLLGKVWAAQADEIPLLTKELRAEGIVINEVDVRPQEFQNTPEDQVVPFMKWLQAVEKIGQDRLPNRSLILEAISHNLRSDYTILSLLGENISVESINRVLGGEFRQPFERSSVIFNNDGSVTIKYRKIEKTYPRQEFDQIIDQVRAHGEERKKEWLTSK